MNDTNVRLILTVGEPAGIGPDIVIKIAERDLACQLHALVDPGLMDQRAQEIGSTLRLKSGPQGLSFGRLSLSPDSVLAAPVKAGVLDARNARYVHKSIKLAATACLEAKFDAMVTAPVHKGVINDAGLAFTGHTELIAKVCGVKKPVMMLADNNLRVALVTTHLPLSEVPAAINAIAIESVVRTVDKALRDQFTIASPRILVCGLNPHAGEEGHLGREEIEIINPCLRQLRKLGLNVIGSLPADTAFAPHMIKQADAVIAMYHDQGLPGIKAQGFGDIVNITLGLPIIRTSVDHGTALDLAGTGRASEQSLLAAIEQARLMALQSK